jgi:HSP20 family protein
MADWRGAFSEMLQLQKEINQLFEQLAHFDETREGLAPGEWTPSVDLFEAGDQLLAKAELPGVGGDDLDVSFKGHTLVISGEKKEPREQEAVGGFVCFERSFGKFSRTLYIDPAVDLTRATARLSQGVLTVSMPMLKDRRGTEIRLQVRVEDEED